MQTPEQTLKQNSILANYRCSAGRQQPGRHLRNLTMLLAPFFAVLLGGAASAEADGPDYWQVTGIAEGSGVNLRLGPATGFRSIGRIPAGATGLQNLGCTPAMNISEFQRLNRSEQKLLQKLSWCRVGWEGQQGWVSTRFLREGAGQNNGSGTAAFNAPAETRRRPGHN